jgi:hypothetical protein
MKREFIPSIVEWALAAAVTVFTLTVAWPVTNVEASCPYNSCNPDPFGEEGCNKSAFCNVQNVLTLYEDETCPNCYCRSGECRWRMPEGGGSGFCFVCAVDDVSYCEETSSCSGLSANKEGSTTACRSGVS